MYASAYGPARLAALAASLHAGDAPSWCVFDNTRLGAAAADALTLRSLLDTGAS